MDAIVQNECLLSLLRHKTIVLVTHIPETIEANHTTQAVTVDDVDTLVKTHQTDIRRKYFPLVSTLVWQPYAQMIYKNEEQQRLLAQYTAIMHDDVPMCGEVLRRTTSRCWRRRSR